MKKSRLLILASALSLGASLPALAALDEIGAVDVSADQFTHAHWSKFGGPVQGLSFLSNDSDVTCDHITANFQDGHSQDVYAGMLLKGARTSIWFPEGPRDLSSVDFACRAENGDGARIALDADIGPYRSAWESSPDWATHWSHVFNNDEALAPPRAPMAQAAPLPPPQPTLVPLASTDFGQLDEHSIMISGGPQRHLDAIALQPLGADARCRSVTAQFDDGSQNNMTINGGAPMQNGQIYQVPVTGEDRNLAALGLTCQAQNSTAVTIKVYGVG